MKDKNLKANVVLSLNKPGEDPQRVEFDADKVSLINIDETTMVLNIVNADGMSIAIKFTKDGEL